MSTPSPRRDGRDTRWAEHRLAKRAQLVEATLRAIRAHGAGVGMEEIAAEAGTSKTVIYRHFTDKAGLYLAVAQAVDELILRDLRAAMGASGASGPGMSGPGTSGTDAAGTDAAGTDAVPQDPRGVISAAIDSYLRLVERDPEVYRFVVTRPLLDRPVEDDPVSGLTTLIGEQIAAMLTAQLRARGKDPAPAQAWGHGLVGLVRAAADHWLSTPSPMPRGDLVQHLTDLAWSGLGAAVPTTEEP